MVRLRATRLWVSAMVLTAVNAQAGAPNLAPPVVASVSVSSAPTFPRGPMAPEELSTDEAALSDAGISAPADSALPVPSAAKQRSPTNTAAELLDAGAPEPRTAARGASALMHSSRSTLPELARLEARAALSDELEAMASDMPRQAKELYADTEKARAQIRSSSRWFAVADIEYGLRQRLAALAVSQKKVDAEIKTATAAAERVEAMLNEAERASEEAQSLGIRSSVRTELRRVVQEAKLVRLTVRRSQASALRLQSRLAEMADEVSQVLLFADTDGPSLSRDLTRTGPSLRRLFAEFEDQKPIVSALRPVVKHNAATLRDFLSNSGAHLLTQMLLGAGLLLSLLWLRKTNSSNNGESDADRVNHFLEHPLASATLLTVATTSFIYSTYPASVLILALGVVVFSAVLLLHGLAPGTRPWQARVLFTVLLIHLGRPLMVDLTGLEHALLLAEGALVTASLAAVLGNEKRDLALASPALAWLRRLILRFWLASSCLGVLGSAVGLVYAGTILISGATISIFAAIVWAAAHRILSGSVRILATRGLVQQPSPAHRRTLVARRLNTMLAACFAFLWVRSTLSGLTLWDPTSKAVERWMALSGEVGSLKISVGSIVALAIGIAIAVYSAKAIRSVLEQDVLPHTSLGIATRAATSTSAYYGLLIVGILLAVGAAGVELDKLTVIVGALSVGIGFGLQNIVQNFVAGLILLFGRPVNVGDRVQLDELTGVVMKIGFRASILRTFQGAEVIVPNSDLISNKVTNWTLSNPDRRMEIDVGVAYGTDPTRVLELLLRVARAHPEVMDQPEPEALFLAHGSSSLDFRLHAWTTNVVRWMHTNSELTVAINRALSDAGIEIPFPQRDLHLRSVDPSVLLQLNPK